MTRSLFLALSAASLGALLGASAAQAGTSVSPPPSVTWSYLCLDARGAKQVMERANQAGAKGWELIAASPHRDGSTWCFRQPSWARPEARSH